jgi:hypothetical protein
MKKCEYNGWYNYETWLVSLWIDNDRSYHERQVMAQEAWDAAESNEISTREEDACYSLADRLKTWISEEDNPLIDQSSLYADLLNHALSEVNWYEIAEHFIEDVDKEEGEVEAE